MEIEVVIEIPKGSRNKYEADHDTDDIWLDRMLFTATMYPTDYGYFPRTLGEDGDPLDAMVLLEEPTFPGCHIRARPIGVFWMTDEKGPDAKIITVPQADPRWSHVQELDDVPQHLLAEIGHFFSIYKDLEGKTVKVDGFGGREDALGEVARDRQRFMDLPEADRPAVP